MIRGEIVSVRFPTLGSEDAYGNEAVDYSTPMQVDDVLIGRGSTVDVIRDGQPFAIQCDKSFCFPRGWTQDLRGALVDWDGKTYEVVGSPTRITDENIPPLSRWNIKAEAVRRDG